MWAILECAILLPVILLDDHRSSLDV